MSVVQGTIQPGQIATYSVQANQYQPLMLVLGSPNGDAVLGVIDPLGNRLLDPANQYTYWQWQLPLTGLYTIQVVGGIEAESFTLTTKVGKLYTYPASGSSLKIYATTVRGLIKSYAFRLSTGISMTVSLNVDPSIAHLDIFGVQTGSILNSSDKVTSWDRIHTKHAGVCGRSHSRWHYERLYTDDFQPLTYFLPGKSRRATQRLPFLIMCTRCCPFFQNPIYLINHLLPTVLFQKWLNENFRYIREDLEGGVGRASSPNTPYFLLHSGNSQKAPKYHM